MHEDGTVLPKYPPNTQKLSVSLGFTDTNTMALCGQFIRRILGGGGIVSRKSFMRLQSTLTSPRLFITFAGRVSASITDEKIKEAFAPFGNLVEAKVIRDRVSGRPKGCAVVTYNTIEEAEKARKRMNYSRLGGHMFIVEQREFESSKQENLPSNTSYTTYMTSEFTQRTRYHMEAEAKGGKYTNKGEVEKQSIKKGDVISLKDLLFTRNRDYLVKNNNEHVKAEKLEGKVIVIYFLPLYVTCPEYSKYYTSLLKDVYYDLLPSNNFEVVLVASNNIRTVSNKKIVHPAHAKDPQIHFDDLFSGMPWTAIPYSDVVSRESMQKSFRIGVDKERCPITAFVVDSMGMVLQCGDWDVFEDFGASGYPFSDERLEFMRAEDDAAGKQPSLKTLLASPERDYVISNKGDQVPVCTFEHKVVALYFHHASVANHSLTEKLKAAYKMLAVSNKKFEVVLVYIREFGLYDSMSDCEESFWKDFKTMPWLALPFRDGDDRCKKLRRVFKISDNGENDPDELVIIGPHAEFIEPLGGRILLQYDFSAYPFTCNKAVELEIEKLKELKLEMLWDKNTIFRRNNGSQVPFSELSGKRIMLVLERIGGVVDDLGENSRNAKFLRMLKARYFQTKGTDDEFEVIRILVDNLEFATTEWLNLGEERCLASLARDLGDMHWIVCLASELMQNICSSYYWYGTFIDEFYLFFPILAFDRDGSLVRKSIFPTFEDIKFPFYARSLEQEMLSEFTRLIE